MFLQINLKEAFCKTKEKGLLEICTTNWNQIIQTSAYVIGKISLVKNTPSLIEIVFEIDKTKTINLLKQNYINRIKKGAKF